MPEIGINLEANYNIVAARDGLDEVMQRWSAESALLREQAEPGIIATRGSNPTTH